MMVLGLTGWALADSLVVDIDVAPGDLTDVNVLYWEGSDSNPAHKDLGNQLLNSNETTEEAWLEALLGKVYDDPNVWYVNRILAGEGGLGMDDKILTNFDPGFTWDYAVVKYDGYWAAYEDDGDGLLTIGSLPNGISHITFFDPHGHTTVPEPATMLLLGSGLICLAGYGRKRFGNK